MSADRAPLPERAANYFSVLRAASKDLNAISDQLGRSIAEIDFALKKLNLGVSVWVPFNQSDGIPEASWFWSEDIGYAKVGANWGVSIRRVEGDYQWPEKEREDRWLFNDSPRKLRLLAIDQIPELLEKLSNEAAKTTKEMRAKLADVEAVASAIKGTTTPAMANSVGASAVASPEISSLIPLTDKDLKAVREAVILALARDGHTSASQLLAGAEWTTGDFGVRIVVAGLGKKMLSLTVNAAAEKIIRGEFQRLGAPTRFSVVPGQSVPPWRDPEAGAKEAK